MSALKTLGEANRLGRRTAAASLERASHEGFKRVIEGAI